MKRSYGRAPFLRQLVYAARYFYPRGHLPFGVLLGRWLAWHLRARLGPRYRAAILPLDAAPRVELLVPDVTEEYELYLYRAPLLEAEFFYLRHLIAPGMRVLNVGANIGIYALAFAQLVGPSGEVYAFEPAAETFGHLVANLHWNQQRNLIGNNLHCHQLAIADVSGMMRLYEYSNHLQRSIVAQKPDQPFQEVHAVSLDSWLGRQGIDHVDLLWIDVEGAEELVLQGAAGLLDSPAAPVVVCELNKKFGSPQQIWNLLARHGYRFWHYNARQDRLLSVSDPLSGEIYTHQQGLPGLGYGNVICAKPSWSPIS
ncbi:MAG TPA: FkbM family methyltransferase [Roseiflexaceae bacterium]|nr:FkbM family methyltransferase [Roseiflexaceae bacterium]